uniref:NADH dehydrogenase subunit 5 n=1 Tax=Heptathela kimurai TaxID=88333 RepID=UPI0031F38C47
MFFNVSQVLLFFSFSFTLLAFLFFFSNEVLWVDYVIMNFGHISIKVELIVDWVSLSFLSCVMFISGCVFMFSIEYMEGENEARFSFLVLLFILSMCLVIMSGNIIFILLGWDGLGLVSFILVIYYQNLKSLNAGMLTILSNRVGDVGILLSIGLLIKKGDWSFVGGGFDGMLLCLLMLASVTKSAQIPFSAWLPAAMAAPTPVSALVHSSTLVTAGVFLMIRIESSSYLMFILFILSSMTMFMSGLAANWEMDLKKIVALSTLSQMGVMMFSCSLSMYIITYFHLLVHAIFKSMMFLCVGMMIHSKVSQDLRFYGGGHFFSPLMSVGVGISGLALMGLPFMSGFYSKDLILEKFMEGGFTSGMIFIVLISFGLTGAYMTRVIIVGFNSMNMGSSGGNFINSGYMAVSIFLLSILGVTSGALLSWGVLVPVDIIITNFEKLVGVSFVILGAWVSIQINWMGSLKIFGLFMSTLWFMQSINSNISIKNVKLGDMLFFIDRSWGEMVGPYGISKNLFLASGIIEGSRAQTLWIFLLSSFMWSLLFVVYLM